MTDNYKYLFFDLDGTIINSYGGIAKTIKYVSDELNLNIPISEYRTFIGPPVAQSFARFANEKVVAKAHQLFREAYINHKLMMDFMLYSGIKETLIELKKRGYNIYIATSKREEPSVEILTASGIIDCFDRVYGAAIDGRKEKYEVLRYALDELRVSPSQCVLIGDTLFDVNGAQAVGMDCIAVTYGFGKNDELKNSTAIGLIDKPEDLLGVFK